MAFHPLLKRCVLSGSSYVRTEGAVTKSYLLNAGRWTELKTDTVPSNPTPHAMTFDARRRRLILQHTALEVTGCLGFDSVTPGLERWELAPKHAEIAIQPEAS
ncbi:MAG: hypothetical protein HYY25_13445 [Candidatus Wallbacteria bacterium]|nr:hypothetical protein [Candidatus Wallbacteria bacterium]